MGKLNRGAALALLVILAGIPVGRAAADTRTENIDVIVALDRSLSMENKIDAVKNYATTYLVDQVLIPGDRFIVVAFYGKADIVVSQTIGGDPDKTAVKKVIAGLRGNGRFTDIGNALDVLQQQATPLENDGRKKFILLLTDGIQEAPPTSRYWSKDGRFNHAFLANTKTIQKKGWKIQILGIGTDTAARDLARELDGSYNEITDTLSVESLLRTTEGLLGKLTLEGPVSVAPVGADGASTLAFALTADGYTEAVRVTIEGVSAQIGSLSAPNLLASPLGFSVRSSGITRLSVPVRFPAGMPAGPASAALAFAFGPGERFSPSEIAAGLRVKGWIGNNLWIVIAAAIVLAALIVLLVLLVVRLVRGTPARFAVQVDGDAVAPGTVTLPSGREIYLNEAAGAYSLVRRRNARSIARFTGRRKAVTLQVLKADRFPKLAEIPPDARGKSFTLRNEQGEKLTLKVVSKERAK
jgi:Mg-chelatase subunit ChlD